MKPITPQIINTTAIDDRKIDGPRASPRSARLRIRLARFAAQKNRAATAASIIIPATSNMRLPVFGIDLSNGPEVQAASRRATTARFRCTPWELEDDLAQAWRRLVAFFAER